MIPDIGRLWAWLGFRYRLCLWPASFGALELQHSGSQVFYRFGLMDRLRLLISGKVMVDIVHGFDALPTRWMSVSEWSVLPPDFPLDGEA